MLTDSRYTWLATYNDGTKLAQIDADGTKHNYIDIDRSKLAFFEIWDGSAMRVRIKFEPGQQLIWRRRVAMTASGISEVCHIVGKKETTGGKTYQGIVGLFENDGRIEIADKFSSNHPWFYEPDYLPEEK